MGRKKKVKPQGVYWDYPRYRLIFQRWDGSWVIDKPRKYSISDVQALRGYISVCNSSEYEYKCWPSQYKATKRLKHGRLLGLFMDCPTFIRLNSITSDYFEFYLPTTYLVKVKE